MATPQLVVATYDFARDGGGIGARTLARTVKFPINAAVTGAWIEQVTPLASGGAATVSLGVEAVGDVIPATAFDNVAFTTARPATWAVAPTGSGAIITSAARTVRFVIAGAALTAGKLRLYFEYATVGAP